MTHRNEQRERTTFYHISSADKYEVYLRRKEQHTLRVTDIASTVSSCYQSVQTIQQVSESKVKIVFTDRTEANHIIQNQTFATRYQVFIPSSLAEISGVIDQEGHDPEALIRYGRGHFHNCSNDSVPVVDCCEVPNRDRESQRTTLLKVTFAGNLLPDFLNIDNSRVPVRSYLQRLEWCKKCRKFERISSRILTATRAGDEHSDNKSREIARRKSSLGMNPPFNLERLVGVICDGLRLDKTWKVLLITLLKNLWNNLMKNAPILGLFGAV